MAKNSQTSGKIYKTCGRCGKPLTNEYYTFGDENVNIYLEGNGYQNAYCSEHCAAVFIGGIYQDNIKG